MAAPTDVVGTSSVRPADSTGVSATTKKLYAMPMITSAYGGSARSHPKPMEHAALTSMMMDAVRVRPSVSYAGGGSVIPTRMFAKLADEDMGMASPAMAGDRLLIRTAARIYCIRKEKIN